MPPHEEADEIPQREVVNVQTKNDSSEEKQEGCCRNLTNAINRTLENAFAKIGFVVATHPWKTILISLLVTGLCLIGVVEYEVENRGEKLWVSQSSDSLKHKDWVEEIFPSQYREVAIMLEKPSENILTPQGLEELYKVYEAITKVEDGNSNTQWKDICYRSSSICIPSSILELCSYNLTEIRTLNTQDILNRVNKKPLISPMTGKFMNAELMIGGPVMRNKSNGLIVSSIVARINIRIKKNTTFVQSKGRLVDENGERWEESFDGAMRALPTPGYTLYYFSEWGANEASSSASTDDLRFFTVGYLLVIIYLSLMLGSFSRLGHKFYLAMAGIAVIGMAVGISYGLGSGFQLKKTNVHDVLAFLLLGIGVDDVFVIVQNWENIGGPQPDGRSIPEKVSAALRNAGVSILVTTLTDVCAFLIGATTILPALRSFCIWCSIGILSVFILTITFFTALLAIDAKRQYNRRDSCLCCIKLKKNWQPMECSERGYLQLFIQKIYGPALVSIPGKIITLLAVAGLLAGGAYGLSKLEQDFDFNWFMPPSSPPRKFTINSEIFFPNNGLPSAAYTGDISYNKEHAAIIRIVNELESDSYVANGTVNSWYHQYKKWLDASSYRIELNRTKECNESVIACELPSDKRFYELLKLFLNTKTGAFFKNDISFHETKNSVKGAAIPFKHVLLNNAAVEIKAMDSVQEHIQPGLTPSEQTALLPFVYSFVYISWETNKVISKELIRNISLAGLCVFIVTLFLLSNLWASLMVVCCVALALIDIAGFMHFWGLTVDTVTTIIMVLAIGLTVDYSTHIAHGFMVSRKPTRNERMVAALCEIGPAVIHGGMSTLLAFILLAASESYVFKTFFKVFFLVVMFGMFHGLVFLPVILSLLGPAPYAVHENALKINKTEGTVNNGVILDEPVRLEKMKQNGEAVEVHSTDPNDNEAYTQKYVVKVEKS